jgi:hypothetical protein
MYCNNTFKINSIREFRRPNTHVHDLDFAHKLRNIGLIKEDTSVELMRVLVLEM